MYRNGSISLEDYMSFMISRETENVQSMSEVVSAFRAITANGDRAYVTEEEISQVKCCPVVDLGGAVWCLSVYS